MEENTIFSRNQNNNNDSKENALQDQSSSLQEESVVGVGQNIETLSNNAGHSSVKGLLLKALVGVLFIGFVIFIVFKFVLPSRQNKNETITLIYWGLWEDPKVMEAVISDFEKQNSQIKVKYLKQDVKQYRERLMTRVQNSTGPDIFRFHNTWIPQVKNILLPFPSDTIKKEEFQEWFYPVVQTDLVHNGAIYGLPLGIDVLALFTNTEALQAAGVKAPTTWNDFGEAARLLTVKDENGKIKMAGAAMGTFDNISHAPDIISLLFLQNGSNIYNLSETSQNASDALDYYTSFAKGDTAVWDETLESSITAFSGGNLAMYFGYSWDIFTIKSLNPNLSFKILAVPHLPGRKMTVASYWAEGISAKSKHQKEALLFIRYLSQRTTAQKFYSESSKTRLFGEPYARTDIAGLLKGNVLIYPFIEQAEGAVSSFFVSDTFDNGLNEQMNGYLGNAVRSILGNTSPQSAVDTLAKGVIQVLKQYEE